MGIKDTEGCVMMMSDSPGTWAVCLMWFKAYWELPPQGGVDHAVVGLVLWGSFCSVESLLGLPFLQSTHSLANLGWQQRRVERKLGCEQSPKVLLHRDMEASRIMWLVRISSRLSESHPESKNIDAAFRLCKACILKWSRCHQAINLLLKWWQC